MAGLLLMSTGREGEASERERGQSGVPGPEGAERERERELGRGPGENSEGRADCLCPLRSVQTKKTFDRRERGV